jgi:hypothetical protein
MCPPGNWLAAAIDQAFQPGKIQKSFLEGKNPTKKAMVRRGMMDGQAPTLAAVTACIEGAAIGGGLEWETLTAWVSGRWLWIGEDL